MNNIKEIFNTRIYKEKEKRSRYNKYIFNSHLVMFLLITIGAIVLNYSNWLEVASNRQMKIVLVIVLICLAYILTTVKLKIFIQEADSIFLLPLEKNYIEIKSKIIIPTIIKQILLILLFGVISYPIINKLNINIVYNISFLISIFISVVLVTIIKYDKIVFSELKNNDLIVIFFLFIISIVMYIVPIVNFGFIFVLTAWYYLSFRKKKDRISINWYGAAEYDKNRNESYLKFINMFVDVPIDIVKISRRKYFDIFLPKLTSSNFQKSNVYNYYYIRSFFRQENTIFLVLRLLLLAIFIVVSISNIYASLFVIISYNYLAVLQLTVIYKKMNSILWFYTIPVEERLKKISFSKLILGVLLVTTTILGLIAIYINFNIINMGLVLSSLFISFLINKYFLNKI